MTQSMLNIINERIAALMQNQEFAAIINNIADEDKKHEFAVKTALATLIIPVDQRSPAL